MKLSHDFTWSSIRASDIPTLFFSVSEKYPEDQFLQNFPFQLRTAPVHPAKKEYKRFVCFMCFFPKDYKVYKRLKKSPVNWLLKVLRHVWSFSAIWTRDNVRFFFSGQLVKGVSTHLKPKYQRCLQRASWRCRVIQPIKKMCSRTNSDVIPLFCVSSGLNTAKLYKWHKFLSVVKT